MLEGATWPLVSNVIRRNSVSNTFGYVRRYANGSRKAHQGWDFTTEIGTTCYAVGDGKVEFVANHGDYGMQLCMSFVAGGETWYAFYAHLQHTYKAAGDRVDLNDVIATAGISGNARRLPAADYHLHFEIRTRAVCGLGLTNRVSPLRVFGTCPLHTPAAG
jgi:peptidoglycan LD-endopeptidase LytH